MPDLSDAAALLEAGDWEAAHLIVQNDGTALGAWAHGIVHLLEGDLANAAYWYGRADRPRPGVEDIEREIAALAAAVRG